MPSPLEPPALPRSLSIKLISPLMTLRPMDSEFKRRMSPSLSLVALASMTPTRHRVVIEDENLRPLDYTQLPDLVGITVNVNTADRAFAIAKEYRARGTKVVLGGIHASANPESMRPHCDAVCIGEAENIWERLLEDLLTGSLQPIYSHPHPTDLGQAPLPSWSFVRKQDYLYTNVLVASRGCPFRCEFCYNSCDYIRHGYRHRPVPMVLAEIAAMETKQVMFIDDNLIGDIGWARELAEAMTPLGLCWHGAVSTNILNHPDLVEKMAKSGCRSLFIGFESINADSLKSVSKGQNKIGEYERLIQLLHHHGIMVNASLVFGFDHDTPETFPRTLEWLVKNRVETMTSHILTPYPGTKLYRRFQSEARITDHDLRKYDTSNVVFLPKNMSAKELRDGYLKMYSDFYSLGCILKRRPTKRSRLAPYFLFNLGYRKYGKFLSVLGRVGMMRGIGNLARRLAYGID